MDFLSQGLLVVGCSDGTIEIWNCESGLLIDILCLKQTNNSTQTLIDKEIKESFDSPKRLHPGGITVMRIIDETRFCVGTSCGIVAYFHLAYPKGNSLHISSISCQWHVHTRAITQLDFLKYFNKCIIENHNDLPDMNSNDIGVIVISGSEDGCIKFCSSEYDSPLLFHCEIDTTPVLSMALNRFAIGVSHASGSLYVCYLDLLFNTTTNNNKIINNSEDKALIKPLEIRLVELTFLSNGGFGVASTVHHHQQQQQPIVSNSGQSKKLSRRAHPGSINLQLFTRINADHNNNNEYSGKNRRDCNKLSPSLLANYRLVTYDMDGTVVIWDLQAKCMIRSFKANLSTFNMSNLLLSVGGRVVFGDQSYLRVVNPWTAKYERSVQLLPPSSVNMRSSNSSRLSALLRQWTKELVPLGVTGGDFKSYKPTELYLIANQQKAVMNICA
ncbi:unnamed protein product [Trichobilharzia szidati]|nr:unnamed protein product [Trichobilharzia szidati]